MMSLSEQPVSFVSVDYTILHSLLASGDWKQADIETATLINQVIEQLFEQAGGEDCPDPIEIVNFPIPQASRFPCLNLQTIDHLWLQYSDGYFGFSTQRPVWNEVGEDYVKFSDRVGWRQSGKWLNYPELTFSKQAPIGHLPALSNGAWARRSGGWVGGWGLLIHCFVHRLTDCESHQS